MGLSKSKEVILKLRRISLFVCGGVMVVLLSVNGLGRYILGRSFIWADEITRIMFVWGCFIGMTSAFVTNGHIGFDLFANKNKTTKKISDLITGIVLAIVGAAVMVYGTKFTATVGIFPLPATGLPVKSLYNAGVFAGVAWILIGLWKVAAVFLPKKQKEDDPS